METCSYLPPAILNSSYPSDVGKQGKGHTVDIPPEHVLLLSDLAVQRLLASFSKESPFAKPHNLASQRSKREFV